MGKAPKITPSNWYLQPLSSKKGKQIVCKPQNEKKKAKTELKWRYMKQWMNKNRKRTKIWNKINEEKPTLGVN